LDFIGFYGVLLEFEERMGVNMQEINSKLWIMVELWRGLKNITFFLKVHMLQKRCYSCSHIHNLNLLTLLSECDSTEPTKLARVRGNGSLVRLS